MSSGTRRYLFISIGLLIASMPHWGAWLLQAGVAASLGCDKLNSCGAAGRMLWLWLVGVLPIASAAAIALLSLVSPGVRSAGALVWFGCLVGALSPIQEGVPIQFLAVSTLLLFGIAESKDHPHFGGLAFVPYATGIYPLIDTARSLLIPAAGINVIPRATAIELSRSLKDLAPEPADVSPWLASIGVLSILAALCWSKRGANNLSDPAAVRITAHP